MTASLPALALVSAYNEAARIGAVIRGVLAHLPVLVVDDGSDDETALAASTAGATVVRHDQNQGKGAALLTGFTWALQHDFQAVVMLDADGQHDPAEIPLFLAAHADRCADLVIGYRDFSQIPLVRRLANSIGRSSLSWALGEPILDNQSGYRLLTRPLLASLQPTVGGFEFEVEMIAQAIWGGYRIDWVPIKTIYAGESSHISPLAHAARFFAMVWRLRRQARRIS